MGVVGGCAGARCERSRGAHGPAMPDAMNLLTPGKLRTGRHKGPAMCAWSPNWNNEKRDQTKDHRSFADSSCLYLGIDLRQPLISVEAATDRALPHLLWHSSLSPELCCRRFCHVCSHPHVPLTLAA